MLALLANNEKRLGDASSLFADIPQNARRVALSSAAATALNRSRNYGCPVSVEYHRCQYILRRRLAYCDHYVSGARHYCKAETAPYIFVTTLYDLRSKGWPCSIE
jgi:hypothetical protein